MFHSIINKILFVINSLTKKKAGTLLFVPHKNCGIDHYDIFNYSADNVLCLFISIIGDEKFNDNDLLLVYYDTSKKHLYEDFLKSFNRKGTVKLVNANSKYEMFKANMHFRICFIAESYRAFLYKTSQQLVIGLNYFTPFKNDQNILMPLSSSQLKRRWINVNHSIDYEMCTSCLSGRVVSTDSMVAYKKMQPLGFPRNDIFYKDSTQRRMAFLKQLSMDSVKHIICYTPTYRDYETSDNNLADKSKLSERSLFGNINCKRDKELNDLLRDNSSIVIAKLHPWQEKSIVKTANCSQFFLFSEIESKMNISLYDILSISDCLITDYTSTAFDFLHKRKPIIYYFYDYEKYANNRGFSYDPIDFVCAGPIAYSFEELLSCIRSLFLGQDDFKNKREFIHKVFNKYQDGHAAERIKNFVSCML